MRASVLQASPAENCEAWEEQCSVPPLGCRSTSAVPCGIAPIAKTLGTVVGCLFDAPRGVLVRWDHGELTLEDRDALDDVAVEVSPTGSIAEQIRDRVEQGLLGLAGPSATAHVQLTRWQRCDGCTQLIAPGRDAIALEYLTPPRLVRLHRGCHGLWELACRAIVGERTSRRA